MGLLKKKKTTQAHEDLASIDAAMEELSKQTDALLGDFGNSAKPTKPSLPKKNAKVSHKGKSFDIIHDPRRKTRINATLKSQQAVNKSPVLESAPETPLLEEHATNSYNEIESTNNDQVKNSAPAAVIKGHEAKLAIATELVESTTQGDDAAVSLERSEDSSAPAVAVKTASQEALSFEDAPESVEEPKSDPLPEDSAELTKEPALDPVEKIDQDIYSSGELHANNLVKEVKPKGYQASESGDAPAIFV